MIKDIISKVRPYRQYASEFFYVLGSTGKKRLLPLIAGFIFLSMLDLLGLSLIGPFVALAANPENLSLIPGVIAIGESVGSETEFQLISLLGLLIVVLFIIKSISGFYVNRSIMKFSLGHQRRVKIWLLNTYLSLPLEKALEKNSAALMTTVNYHTTIFTNRIMVPGLKAVSELVFFLFLFVFLFVENAIVSLSLGVLFSCLAVIYDVIVRRRIKQSGEDILRAGNSSAMIINQAADGFKEIRIAGAEPFFLSELDRFSDLFAKASTFTQSMSVIPRYMIEASVVTFVVVLLLLGLVVYGGPSPEFISTVGIFAFASIRSMSSVNTLLASSNHLRFGRPALRDLVGDLEEAAEYGISPEPDDQAQLQEKTAMPFNDMICAKEVSFTYPSKVHAALSKISLCIKKGDSVGLIGESGSGKTTLVDILLGLLHPQKGIVTVDGRPIRGDLRPWMNNIAYIPQSVFLVDDTIVANIALGVPGQQVDEKRLHEAIKWSQLETMIAALPQKEMTVIGERGARISGGQRQRIALARALYHQRGVLVMDEATAALDSKTEQEIVEAIKGLRGRVTLIIIAHRLTTLRYCNTIHRLEAGRIVETGSYESVVASA